MSTNENTLNPASTERRFIPQPTHVGRGFLASIFIKNLGKVQYGEILAIIESLGYRKKDKVTSNPYIHSRGYHVPREIENIPIDNMNLENRLRNVLYREGYRTVGKIMRMKKESLQLIHGIGDKSIDELMRAVKRIEKEGIELRIGRMNQSKKIICVP